MTGIGSSIKEKERVNTCIVTGPCMKEIGMKGKEMERVRIYSRYSHKFTSI